MSDDASTRSVPDSYFTRGVTTEQTGDAPAFLPGWASRATLPAFAAAPGITMQSFSGGELMANWVTIEPDQAIPTHQHPHEQIGVILEGGMELTIGDETRTLRPGDAYSVPPHLPHGGRATSDGCVVLDVFTPLREYYAARARAAART